MSSKALDKMIPYLLIGYSGGISKLIKSSEVSSDFLLTLFSEIICNTTGKVLNIVGTSASSKPGWKFHYDSMLSIPLKIKVRNPVRNDTGGNRIVKIVINKIPSQTPGEFEPQSQDEWDYTFYCRDASGNCKSSYASPKRSIRAMHPVRYATGVMAVYSKSFSSCTNEDFSFVESLDLTELHIYGSSRIGMRDGKGNTISNCLNSSGAPAGIQVGNITYEVMTGMSYSSIDEEITSELNQDSNEPCATYFTLIEYKTFELSDHLGNVSATISDRKISVWNSNEDAVVSYNPDVLSQQDYYPFGMGMVGRAMQLGNEYEYSFNGKTLNREVSTAEVDFGERLFNVRTGRWITIDPLHSLGANISPFAFVRNSPIYNIDPDGRKEKPYVAGVSMPYTPFPGTETYYMQSNKDGSIRSDATHTFFYSDDAYKAYNCHSFSLHGCRGDKPGKNATLEERNEYDKKTPLWDGDPTDDIESLQLVQLHSDVDNKVGDIVFYYHDKNRNGKWDKGDEYNNSEFIGHSALVKEVDSEGNTTVIGAKNGQEALSLNHPAAPGYYQTGEDEIGNDGTFSRAYFRRPTAANFQNLGDITFDSNMAKITLNEDKTVKYLKVQDVTTGKDFYVLRNDDGSYRWYTGN